ncbi:MAG: site-2 protease family protein [Pirellulales bacterium]|nr:site-2 protease family protein [Pirellulales bacterium]
MPEPYEDDIQPIPAEVIEVIPADDWRLRQYAADHPFPPLFPSPPPRRRIYLPIFLFVATCFTTFGVRFFVPGVDLATRLIDGLQYSACIMTILFCHEMGHFLQSLRYKIRASLPYFIPLPLPPFGTMGAVIVMKSRLGSRRSLFDVGITGPLAGLVPTLICCIVGIYWSEVKPEPRHLVPGTVFNDPLIFQWLCTLLGRHVPEGYELMAHPVAFAGWVGLFITSLNLIPIGQLDGGHVLYALLRRKSYLVVRLLLMIVFLFMIFNFSHYWQWLFLLSLLMLLGIFHPPTANDHEDLGWFRTALGILILLFIPLGFTPQPFKIQDEVSKPATASQRTESLAPALVPGV